MREETNAVPKILEAYKNGQRIFKKILVFGESFNDQILNDVEFIDCNMYTDFRFSQLRNAKFFDGAIKSCDFREADLTNATFEKMSFEHAQFAGAKTDGVLWIENYAYGSITTQADFEEWIKIDD
jgi:uncharacterized protein YjbI with pentapeptide repeats